MATVSNLPSFAEIARVEVLPDTGQLSVYSSYAAQLNVKAASSLNNQSEIN